MPQDKAPATAVIQQLLRQLKVAHLQKVVHCDIRPSNVIQFADGSVRLGDWGCSGELDDKGVFESQPVGVLAWLSDSAVKKSKCKTQFFKYTIYDDLESLAFLYCALMIGASSHRCCVLTAVLTPFAAGGGSAPWHKQSADHMLIEREKSMSVARTRFALPPQPFAACHS